jgi:twitching motility two-component system response regulator PilG
MANVSTVVQRIQAEEKTCFPLIYINGKRKGAMCFYVGVLYDAVYEKLTGTDAALALIGLENVQLKYREMPSVKITRQINTDIKNLINKAEQLSDESAVVVLDSKGSSSEKLLEKGIQLCEGLHLKKAQKFFLEVVSRDPDNTLAFLWLSRTVSNMKQLRAVLAKVYKLDQEHKDILDAIRSYNTACKIGLTNISHCPFCFAPIVEKAVGCQNCGASLVINSEILSKINARVDTRKMSEAFERFERVLAREQNIPVLFYICLACLHLNDTDSALEYLEQLQYCIDPEESIYAAPVECILGFVASKQIEEGTEIVSSQSMEYSTHAQEGKRKKILVVEDSQTTRKVIKMTLESNNFHVVEAEDGIEALTKLNDEHPDLILLDVMLPKLDGYGILSVLKKNDEHRSVPVVMLTSKDGLKDKLKGRFSAASAYLTKPFNPDTLIQKVNKFIT